MTRLDAYSAVLKLTAVYAKLARVEVAAAAAGKPPPANLPVLKAEAHVLKNAIGLALDMERSRQRHARAA